MLPLEAIKLKEIPAKKVDIAHMPFLVAVTPHPGCKIDGSDLYTVSRGPVEYDVIVNCGGFAEKRGMHNSTVPENERWTQKVNRNAIVLNLDNGKKSTISEDVLEIERLANLSPELGNPILRPDIIKEYWDVVKKIINHEKIELADLNGLIAIVALRAAYPMTKMFGVPDECMALLDAKRLKPRDGSKDIAVGLNFANFNGLDRISLQRMFENTKILTADPALATLSTQLAILALLFANDIKMQQYDMAAVIGSQKGMELASDVADDLISRGIKSRVIAAAAHPILTGGDHPYYIMIDRYGKLHFSIGDGGDFSDLLLPPQYRKLWPAFITEGHYRALKHDIPQIDWSKMDIVGMEVNLENMYNLQIFIRQVAPKLSPDILGHILTGI